MTPVVHASPGLHTTSSITDRLPPLRTTAAAGNLVVGVSGARQNGAVAAVLDGRLAAACEQERLTRVRSAPLHPSRLPEEALSAVLHRMGRGLNDVQQFVTAEITATLP